MTNALKTAVIIMAFVGIFLAGSVIGGVAAVHFTRGHFQRFEGLERERFDDQQRRFRQMTESLRQQLGREEMPRGQMPLAQGQRTLPLPEQFSAQLMRRFAERLELTPEQRQTIAPLVDDAAENMRRLRRDTFHRTELILDQVEDRISAVLTPAQRDRFKEMIQNQRDRVQRFTLEQQRRMEQQRRWDQSPPSSPAPPAAGGDRQP